MPIDRLGAIPRSGSPRVERVGWVGEDVDLHELALTLECPSLVERGDAPRESWHVLPMSPRGILQAARGEVAIAWPGEAGLERRGPGRGLDALRALLDAIGTERPPLDVPFAGGLVVLLGYGLAHEIERLPSSTEDRDGLPDLVVQACPAALLVPRGGGDALFAWLPALVDEEAPAIPWGLSSREARLCIAWAKHAIENPRDHGLVRGGPTGEPRALWRQDDHEDAVRRVIEDLNAGEIYQANVTQRFEVGWRGSALPLHSVLRRTNPSPFSGWMRGVGEDWQLVSGSPERLVRLLGRDLQTEPIKGTVPLPDGPRTSDADVARLSGQLLASEKDRAEHVMIVDLHRNDLGRVSAPGTVRVAESMRIDRRSHVLQAVADIRGILADGKDAVDVIEAMFPGGSVTGVPKIRAMEILDSLERWSRGPYTGSFGFVAPWGDLDLNILIRSAWQVHGRLAFAAGGGIVLDSDPTREYHESLAKLAAMRGAIRELAGGS